MLKGWPIALVAATGASALFAFGIVQSMFATQALALFIVFGALLALMMLTNRLFGGGGGGHAHAAHGHGGDHAVVMSGRSVGAIAVVAALLAVAFFWTDNDLSGEKIGRFLDKGAVALGQQAQTTLVRLTDRRDAGAAEEQQASPSPQDG